MDDPLMLVAIGVVSLCVVVVSAVITWTLFFRGGAPKAPSAGTRGESAAERFPAGPLHIFFGSQTGTAEGFSRTLVDEGRARGFNAKAVDLEDFDPDELQEVKVAVFLMATYGEGEPTDNSSQFYTWLKNEDDAVPSDFLASTQFTVFGLGNTQYEHYNRMGKVVNTGLEAFGASRCFAYGEGDDNGTLEEDFDAWKEKMWESLTAQFHPDGAAAGGGEVDLSVVPELPFSVSFSSSDVSRAAPIPASAQHGSTRFFFTSVDVPVTVNRELRDIEDGGSTRHMELDLAASGIRYRTADNLAVLPENSDAVVEAVAAALGYDMDATFVVQSEDDAHKHAFPTPCTVRTALKRYLDLQGIPRRSTVAALTPFVADGGQRALLDRLVNKDNRAEFNAHVVEGCRSLADLLTGEFSSAEIPLEHLVNLCPVLQPRYYTISSSSTLHPTSVHATVSVTQTPLPDGRVHLGVCSSYMQQLDPAQGHTCRVFVRDSSFRLPAQVSTPIIMIGPGTGIAPMRALLQERKCQGATGSNTLYFGCRKRSLDYLYRDELEAYQAEGTLSQLHLAFSRETPGQKVYVQNLMQQPAQAKALVEGLMDQGAYLFVCGATAMGSDVHDTLLTLLQQLRSMSREAAEREVKSMQDAGRYVQELWSA